MAELSVDRNYFAGADRAVAKWLLAVAALVFCMIVVGVVALGIDRLFAFTLQKPQVGASITAEYVVKRTGARLDVADGWRAAPRANRGQEDPREAVSVRAHSSLAGTFAGLPIRLGSAAS